MTDAGPHVGMKRLIAYRQGTLPAAEREALQEHLSLCPRCTGLLRELRDFEAASADGGAAGPEPLKQEAWDSLVRRLPRKEPAVRPVAEGPLARRRAPYVLYGAAAALLLAVLGLAAWTAVTVRQERQRLALLEQRLDEREEALAAARGQIRDLERAKGEQADSRVRELTNRVAELTSELERLRRSTQASPVLASREVELSVAPRFALRGQEPREDGLLRGGGAVNPVRMAAQADRFTVALSLADHPVYNEYRLVLIGREGKVLWDGRRPSGSLLGDAGTSVSVAGLGPGRYRLRIEGVQGPRASGRLLAEYVLEVGQAN